jgi:hypothetical protein
MKVHELKIKQNYFNDIRVNDKSFEIRKNDRGFEVGDILLLKVIDEVTEEYTGHDMFIKVMYIHKGLGLADGYVCMSIKRVWFYTESEVN